MHQFRGKYLEGDISLPNDADYMYWMIKSHELGFSPSFCFLGYAFMEGIPTLKVERNYPKALYYFQDYWVYRPALEEGKVHWWEDQSLSEKFASLWDLGYEPCSTNEKPAQLQVIPNSVKVSDNGNIVAGGKVYVTLQVKNVGMGDSDFSIVLSEISDNSGLSIRLVSIPLISPGETKSIVIPILGQNKLRNGNIPISFKVCDPRGSETVPVDIVLHAHVK